ncbi:hypothetical protein FISHEDRAFT_38854 [Fistulina hepatica ATCC 64428]|uniref:Tethering factor for nuclear proteasome STS1 n=1 Tax=Fistulina hepatica ATCC 64428 TaxID=1128425 RepID=A0A0D7AJP5_9AGAR|nr:hypothetical protein FISHEDRAFT_38854 [Fistulina hepatica ATCC 64428]
MSPHIVSSSNHDLPSRPKKRSHDADDPHVRRDASMDRSPTPERPKKTLSKRLRTISAVDAKGKRVKTTKSSAANEEDADFDLGLLLNDLPATSLRGVLTALIDADPSLRKRVLSFIPAPTLQTALAALADASKRLHEAHPYSFSSSSSSSAFSQTSSFSAIGASAFSIHPFSSVALPGASGAHMRDSYITSRLEAPIQVFVSTCLRYLPYFSFAKPTSIAAQPFASSATQHHSALISAYDNHTKAKLVENYMFLAALTGHYASQPAVVHQPLASHLLERLGQEWHAWVDETDAQINKQGAMLARSEAEEWTNFLDSVATSGSPELSRVMRGVRDKWSSRLGWLIGRTPMVE